jgi:hypothetical protein
MKNILLSSLILSCTVINMYAQGSAVSRSHTSNFKIGDFKYGIKIGPSFFWHDNQKGNKYSDGSMHTNTRFHGGIFGEYALTDAKALYIDILYVGKGVKANFKKDKYVLKSDSNKKLISESCNLDYLVIAPGLTGYPGDDKNFFVLLSLYVGYMLSAKSYITSQHKVEEKTYYDKFDLLEDPSDLQKVDVGFIYGAGYEFDSGLILSLTADIGLRSIYKDTERINFGGNSSVGYNFAKLF